MTVWSALENDVQCIIVHRFSSNESYVKLAEEYDLNAFSLRRKMLRLKELGYFERMKEKGEKLFNLINSKKTQPTPVIHEIKTEKNFLQLLAERKTTASVISDQDIRIKDHDLINERIAFLNRKKRWSILYFTDLHCPLQDEKSIQAMLRVMQRVDHNLIVNGGDNLDLYGLSKFPKNNDTMFRLNFAKEVAEHDKIMERIAAVTNAPKISLYGNHMDRYDRWLNESPFMTVGLNEETSLSLDNILKMYLYGWHKFVGSIIVSDNEDGAFPKPSLIFTHGTKAARGGGNSSLSAFKDFGAVSYVMGHVHRLAVSYKRTLHGIHCMAEGGTMCDINPEYMKYPDWQNGMLHITAEDDVVSITPILFNNGIAELAGVKI